MYASNTRFPVLVTGGAGYIGSHVVLALQDAGWPVVVVDNLVTGFRSALPFGAPLYQTNVGDSETLQIILRAHRIAAVIHLADSMVVTESGDGAANCTGNYAEQSRALFVAAIKEGVSHFVLGSTAAVYGTPETSRVSEDSLAEPVSPYGVSKLKTETLLREFTGSHEINHCIMRHFSVAGADPKGRAGQSTRGAQQLMKVAVKAASGKRSHVDIFGTDYDTHDGTAVRDYIHVSDLASAYVLALEALIENPDASLTLNCGYGRGYSASEVLDAVDRVSDGEIERRKEPRRTGNPGELIADNERILATLPWSPRYQDIDVIARHALGWERQLKSRPHA